MRNLRDRKRIETARNRSISENRDKLVIADQNKREFFRFESGEMVEYDLTKYNGTKIEYTDEEQESIRKLGESNF